MPSLIMSVIALASLAAGPEPSYKAGYRQIQWNDQTRARPVWVDVWYPASEGDERELSYGLGKGSGVRDAKPAQSDSRFPLVVMSHGAMGSARDYGWLAEYLARRGVVVLGVSHYGESWVYGPKTVDPKTVLKLWLRPVDCSFALDQFLKEEDFRDRVDASAIIAVGHSSGGATVLALAGAVLNPAALRDYCQSNDSEGDHGCDYSRDADPSLPAPPEASASYRDPRVRLMVAIDPAAGPGFTENSLKAIKIPALVIGSEQDDFLPFEHHAKRVADLIPGASLIALGHGEGHFVYMNTCTAALKANGVSLCVDRDGVDRAKIHETLAPQILEFIRKNTK